jgi:voltage-gated potassium channel
VRKHRRGWRAVSKRPSPVAAVLVSLLLVVVATTVYYLIPVPGPMREVSWAALFGGGVAALGVLIVFAIRRLLHQSSEDTRIRGLLLLLVLTVLFFSYSDRSVSELPGQFTDLHTKTDSLYFNVSTLATVGFGDVHPVGQLARAAVTLQIVFNLVFLGAAVSMITGFFRMRARRTHPAGREHESPATDEHDRAAGHEQAAGHDHS